jgi:hypothetical protein
MLRMFRPDLLFGLGGFALGAAALLLMQGVEASPPPPARHSDLLTQAAPTARTTPRQARDRES